MVVVDESETSIQPNSLTVQQNPTNESQLQVDEPPIRMRVSSAHLMLASPVFLKMLSGPWKEGALSTFPREIYTSEWDAKALSLLLDIIHGHHWDVPRSLDLETLAKLAVIIDYYQCHEIIGIFVDKWLVEMEKDLPVHHGKASVLWLCVSWVFSRQDIFNAMAELALRHQDGPIAPTGLPIAFLLAQIEQRRQELITIFVSELDGLRVSLSNDGIGCTFECSCMLLGALMKEMQNVAHLRPPFYGNSITSVMKSIGRIPSPRWYKFHANLHNPSTREHSCGLAEPINHIKRNVEAELGKFRLEDFGSSKCFSRADFSAL
ncbi:hypothetical protein BGZ63DRAFT_359733 [Mariannaea sp. PMI_226]|nr:hypothetical protein BGZ63DRAFT_359733 [Mariannaea sp. PMI_226]